MKFGTSTTWNGMMRVARMSANRGPRPRNGRTANANAAIEQLISWPIVFSVEILSELTKNVPKVTSGRAFHIFA